MSNEQDDVLAYLRDHSVSCDRCAYDLHGVNSSCCPECGHELTIQGLELMVVAQEMHEYNWHQSMKWFKACGLALTITLILDIAIVRFFVGGWLGANRGRIIFSMGVLILLNEWFRHWVRVEYRNDNRAFRSLITRVQLYFYTIFAGATLFLLFAGLRLILTI